MDTNINEKFTHYKKVDGKKKKCRVWRDFDENKSPVVCKNMPIPPKNVGKIVSCSNKPSDCIFDDWVELNPNDPNFMSPNQKLVGNPNPKTNIPPVIVNPSHDLDYWKKNNLITHSAINYETQQDVQKSGFFEYSDCGDDYLPCQSSIGCDYDEYEYYPTKKQKNYPKENYPKENYPKENYPKEKNYPYLRTSLEEVNLDCCYNPDQLEFNLPTNYAAGKCEQNEIYGDYNKNLYTQIIEPGIYYKSEVNQPINSNIGISFDPSFLPTTKVRKNNETMYIEHDPNLTESRPRKNRRKNPINVDNIYDPRQNGYGTSYRSYVDDRLGQPRFMYDDINAIKMPNYLVRSNIDHLPFADSYGPMETEDGNEYTSRIRKMANDAFLDSTLQFRSGLQESLMRKRNSEMWQLRKAPIRTNMK